jgi:hypothetical protein
MVLAIPLGRMIVQLGPPLHIDPDEPQATACLRLKTTLDAITEALDLELHGRPLWKLDTALETRAESHR